MTSITPNEASAESRFPLGLILITPEADEGLSSEEVDSALARHSHKDWGDVGEEEWKKNNRSLRNGSRVFSVYHAGNGSEFWVITEPKRTITTIILPNER